MTRSWSTVACVATLVAVGCARPRVALDVYQGDEHWGAIVLELRPDKTPITVENFLRYVDDGFYDRTILHRVNPEYVIQGGGYEVIGELKAEGLRPPIKNEYETGLSNLPGTIGMARDTDPDSADSQFFINVDDNSARLDRGGPGGAGYCAFGRVVAGQDVIDRICAVERVFNAELPDKVPSQPRHPPLIRTARRR